jgi:hypothetical protein
MQNAYDEVLKEKQEKGKMRAPTHEEIQQRLKDKKIYATMENIGEWSAGRQSEYYSPGRRSVSAGLEAKATALSTAEKLPVTNTGGRSILPLWADHMWTALEGKDSGSGTNNNITNNIVMQSSPGVASVGNEIAKMNRKQMEKINQSTF